MSLLRLLIVLGLCWKVIGCGTVTTLTNTSKECSDASSPALVYSGVIWDLNGAAHTKLITLLDLPLSAIADTLVLPYTIPVSMCGDS